MELRKSRQDIPPDLLHALQRFIDGAMGVVSFEKAILFGSRARGVERSDSDVDVALVFDIPQNQVYSLSMRLADLSAEVLLDDGYVITPVLIPLEYWDHPDQYTNPELLRNIKREGIQI